MVTPTHLINLLAKDVIDTFTPVSTRQSTSSRILSLLKGLLQKM